MVPERETLVSRGTRVLLVTMDCGLCPVEQRPEQNRLVEFALIMASEAARVRRSGLSLDGLLLRSVSFTNVTSPVKSILREEW